MPALRSLLGDGFGCLWVMVLLTGVFTAPLYSLFAVYVEDTLRRPPLFTASIRSVLWLLGGLSAVPGGILCDRIGVKRTYAIGLTGSIAVGGLFMTRDPLWLMVLSLYAGAAFGLSSTGGPSYLIASVSPASLGLGSAAYFIGDTVGGLLGNSVGGPLADARGFRALGCSMVVATTAVAIAAALLLPVPSGEARRSRQASSGAARLREIVGRREVALVLALRFLPTFYWGVAALLIPLLIFRMAGTKTAAAHYGAASLVVAAITQLLTGWLGDRFGRRRPMLVAAYLIAVSASLLAVFGSSLAGLYLFGIMGAASAWSLSTTMPGLVADVSGDGEKGRVLGALQFCWSAAILSGSLVGGKLVEWSAAAAFGAGAAAAVLAALCATLLYAELAPARREQSPAHPPA